MSYFVKVEFKNGDIESAENETNSILEVIGILALQTENVKGFEVKDNNNHLKLEWSYINTNILNAVYDTLVKYKRI